MATILSRRSILLGGGAVLPWLALTGMGRAQEAFASPRRQLSAPLTICVDPAGSDDNDGLSAPFQTITAAWNAIRDNYDLRGYRAFIKCADGFYPDGVFAIGMPPGAVNGLSIQVLGNKTNPSAVVLGAAGSRGNAIQVGDSTGSSTQVRIDGFCIEGIGHGIEMHTGGALSLGNIDFGDCPGHNHIWFHTGGFIRVDADGIFRISGSAKYHAFLSEGGLMSCHGRLIEIAQNAAGAWPSMGCWAYAGTNSVLVYDWNNFINKDRVTGTRFLVELGGTIAQSSPDLTYLPGDIAGANHGGFIG